MIRKIIRRLLSVYGSALLCVAADINQVAKTMILFGLSLLSMRRPVPTVVSAVLFFVADVICVLSPATWHYRADNTFPLLRVPVWQFSVYLLASSMVIDISDATRGPRVVHYDTISV